MNQWLKTSTFKWLMITGVVFTFCNLAVIGKAWHDYMRPGPLMRDVEIVIPHGGYASTITCLQKEGILSSSWWTTSLFQIAIVLTRKDGRLHAAEFHFPAHSSMQHILWILRHAKPVEHKLTIPEGLTAYQIKKILDNAPFLVGITPLPAEGSVLPQTYNYRRNSQRKDLLKRMQTDMTKTLHKTWKEKDTQITLQNPKDLLILASLIEKETTISTERPLVARVFFNRLKKGMKLQTDPTVIYAITHGRTHLGHPLSHTDLQVQSPYNTYLNTGLPPGPICTPSISSLQAAAHPAKSEALYFVADGTGGHHFSKTLEEHNHYVSLLREKEISLKKTPK
ncbi:MAG: endolytic transglycosylase MltG [Acetobacter sp.]|nr:endolytic transglycosylase MltG [Acetobacter sp.]